MAELAVLRRFRQLGVTDLANSDAMTAKDCCAQDWTPAHRLRTGLKAGSSARYTA